MTRQVRFELLQPRILLTSVPELNSFLGAEKQIYLDFDGDSQAEWRSQSAPRPFTNVTTPPFDLDGNSSDVGPFEAMFIEQVWRHVAEDFRPFMVNVTTVEPQDFSDGIGMRVVIGGNGNWHSRGSGLRGIAPSVGSFYDPLFPNTAFVFSQNILTQTSVPKPRFVADTISHEAGHMLDLNHQSRFHNTINYEEYNTGDERVAPIMGSSFNAERSVWFNGLDRYEIPQDELQVLTSDKECRYCDRLKGLEVREDDHGNSIATSTPLFAVENAISAEGIIETNDDIDFFRFNTSGGQVDLFASVLPSIANLDTRLEIRDARNGTLAASSPTDSLNATISINVAPGTYYVVVANSGEYGALGEYWLSANFTPGINPSEQFAVYRNTRFLLDSGRPGFEGFELVDSFQFGLEGDVPIVGDWDGNGIDDLAVFRPETGTFILDSGARGFDGPELDTGSFQFGLGTDRPVVGDWNGDGIDDLGVFRPDGGLFILDSRMRGFEGHELDEGSFQFGLPTDSPVIGDWNGDGIDDLGVFRPSDLDPNLGQFILDTGERGFQGHELTESSFQFGLANDIPVVGDWNGDGIDDLGVYRPNLGNFIIDTGPRGFDGPEDDEANVFQFGLSGDYPLVGIWGTADQITTLSVAPVTTFDGFFPDHHVTRYGDFNEDGRINSKDIDTICAAISGLHVNQQFDFNRDGVLSDEDISEALDNIFRVRLGDVNFDGVLDSSDLISVFQSGKYENPFANNAQWSEGDWNCDGIFSSDDVIYLLQRGG